MIWHCAAGSQIMVLDECEPNRWYCAFHDHLSQLSGNGLWYWDNLYGIEAITYTYVEKNHSRNALLWLII